MCRTSPTTTSTAWAAPRARMRSAMRSPSSHGRKKRTSSKSSARWGRAFRGCRLRASTTPRDRVRNDRCSSAHIAAENLSPLFKDVFLFHWKEESQHAILDELELIRWDRKISVEARDHAVDEL